MEIFILFLVMDNKKITASHTEVEKGKNIKILCKTHSYARWFFKNSNLPSNAIVSRSQRSLTLISVTLKNAGAYSCYGTFNNYLNEHFLATVTIKVFGEYINIFTISTYVTLSTHF